MRFGGVAIIHGCHLEYRLVVGTADNGRDLRESVLGWLSDYSATFFVSVALLLIIVAWRCRAGRGRTFVISGTLLFCFVSAIVIIRDLDRNPTPLAPTDPDRDEVQAVTNRPIQDPANGYVGSDACRDCHTHEHATWHASWHRTMTQIATPESVIADFTATLTAPGFQFDLKQEGDEFFFDQQRAVETLEGLFREDSRYQIVMTTGAHHMQACWFALRDDSRILGMFPYIYLKKDQRWVPRNSVFLKPETSMGDEAGRWNVDCIVCHATFGRVDVNGVQNPATWKLRDADTRVAEFGISCEACHGPGEKHVEDWQRVSVGDHAEPAGARPSIVHPGNLPHRSSSQVCGQCHGIYELREEERLNWIAHGFEYRPGGDLADDSRRFLLRCSGSSSADYHTNWESQFWSDGMVRVSGREYNGLIESPCFQRGEMSCISCHQLHQSVADSRPVKEWANDQLAAENIGNTACTNCHQQFDEPSALVAHTHHRADSTGSHCYNCHMPHTTYGLLKAIRSHQIDSPDVAVSLRTGRPNACNQCHLDRTLAWSAQQLSDWYNIAPPELTEPQRTVAASVLWLLQGDAGQRALMAWSYGWEDGRAASGSDWMAPYLCQLLQDPYDAVRYIAWHSLWKLPGYESFEYDFVGDPALRRAASARGVEQWTKHGHLTEADRARALLLDDTGLIRTDEFDRLLKDRNDREVNLNE